MIDKNKLANAAMSDEELDNVAGGIMGDPTYLAAPQRPTNYISPNNADIGSNNADFSQNNSNFNQINPNINPNNAKLNPNDANLSPISDNLNPNQLPNITTLKTPTKYGITGGKWH